MMGLWSLGSLFLVIKLFINQKSQNSNQSHKRICSNLSFKKICLLLHGITHLIRIAYAFDGNQPRQIYTYPPTVLLLIGCSCFEIASHILMSFLIRELTQANKLVNMKKKLKFAYLFICVFLIVDLTLTTIEAFQLNKTQFPSFFLVVFFYILVNSILGVWYFVQGYKFLRRSVQYEKILQKENRQRITLTRLSMCNSVGLILFALNALIISLPEIYGYPWGYFVSYFLLFLNLQLTSLFEIILFGGVSVAVPFKVRESLKLLANQISRKSLDTIEI